LATRTLHLSGGGEGGCKPRPEIERVGAFAGFGFDILGDDGEPFGFGKAGDGGSLGFDPETGALLPLSGDS
jgi:hypothetical protein